MNTLVDEKALGLELKKKKRSKKTSEKNEPIAECSNGNELLVEQAVS